MIAVADPFIPAFLELAQELELGKIPNSETRHLVFTGKSARLLRTGDQVAMRDISALRTTDPGVAEILSVRRTTNDSVVVTTTDHHVRLIPGSRLLVVHRQQA